MKWFTKNHSHMLSVATVIIIAVLSCAHTASAHGGAYNYDNNGSYCSQSNNDYSYGNYNNGYSGSTCNYNYPYNNNYNQQYYLSPLMTSTVPYPVHQYMQYPNYNNGYNYNYNNYNNGYYGNYGYSQLSVSCYANTSYVAQGQPVTWNASANGGVGNYSYSWSGTDNPTSLNINSINVTYQNPGIKNMSVTVYSADGQTVTVSCGQATVSTYYNYPNYSYPNQYYNPQQYWYR